MIEAGGGRFRWAVMRFPKARPERIFGKRGGGSRIFLPDQLRQMGRILRTPLGIFAAGFLDLAGREPRRGLTDLACCIGNGCFDISCFKIGVVGSAARQQRGNRTVRPRQIIKHNAKEEGAPEQKQHNSHSSASFGIMQPSLQP